jgi:hypothetical protein
MLTNAVVPDALSTAIGGFGTPQLRPPVKTCQIIFHHGSRPAAKARLRSPSAKSFIPGCARAETFMRGCRPCKARVPIKKCKGAYQAMQGCRTWSARMPGVLRTHAVFATQGCRPDAARVLALFCEDDTQQLWQPTINLTGTISDATYAVWVNGVKGTNNGDGTWGAQNVPVDNGGTASFTVTGYSPDETQPDGSHGN